MHQIETHADGITDMVVTRDGKSVISASHDGTLKMWDLATGEQVREFSMSRLGRVSNLQRMAISPNGRLLIASCNGGPSGRIGIWEVETGKFLRATPPQPSDIKGVAISPDGDLLASTRGDGLVQFWDIGTAAELASHPLAMSGWAVAFDDTGRHLAVGGDAPSGIAASLPPDPPPRGSGGR